jgi:hypothetical protein
MRRIRPSALTLLATVPYLLLSGAQQVHFRTIVQPDGSGYRFLVVDASTERVKDLGDHVRIAQKSYDFAEQDKSSGYVRLERNFWTAAIGRLPEAQLAIGTLIKEPLSLFTKYEWGEKLTFKSEDATEVERVGAAQAILNYTVEMPGTIAQESVSPTGQVEGNTVTFKLAADKAEQEVKVTSYELRYGYIAVLLYLLACAAVFGGRFLRGVLLNRPRKI